MERSQTRNRKVMSKNTEIHIAIAFTAILLSLLTIKSAASFENAAITGIAMIVTFVIGIYVEVSSKNK